MFFIIKKSEETTLEFSQNVATVVWLLLLIIMETQNIPNLLGDADNESSKFATRIWYIIISQKNTNYGKGNKNDETFKFGTKVIKSNPCDYPGAYILVTGNILATGNNVNKKLYLKIVLHLQNA